MKLCPCRYCEKRTMFCHSSCVDYIEWKKDYEKEKKRIQDVNCVLYNKQRKQTYPENNTYQLWYVLFFILQIEQYII